MAKINIEDQKDEFYYGSDRSEIMEFLPKTAKKVLDVGCAEGNFASSIKRRNQAEVWGIEYSKEAAKVAEEKVDKIFVGDAQELVKDLPEKHFDLITCNDVLEHLVDPYTTIEILREKISPGGHIFASLPQIRYYKTIIEIIFKKDFKYVDAGVMDRTHLRFFTKKSIKRMFEEAGYEVLKMKGLNKSKSIRPFFVTILSLGFISDSKYIQYGILAKPKS